MLPISSNQSTPASLASHSSNTTTRSDSTHAEENAKAESVMQISESCVVSNQLCGPGNTVTTNLYFTASDPNTKLIFEKLNGHAEASRYKPLAQLGTQIEELRTAYLNVLEEIDEIRDGLALYIPSEGQETADSKIIFPLIDKVHEFLSSKKKVLLLLGEAGSGKSTFNRHLTRMLWDEYKQSPASPIPIFIALAEHTPSSADLIESYLLEQEFSPEAITVLRKEKRLVFILDGFDEIKDRAQEFYTQNKLDYWKNAQVIISSRPEYLGKSYRSQFQKRGQTSALQEYWLSPISDDWIAAYIQKYSQHIQRTGWDLTRYQNTLNNLPTLKEAIRRPFLLRMALDLLPDLAESGSEPMTRIALYDAFISRWWNRSEERLQHIKLTKEEKYARNKLGQHLAAEGLGASQEMAIALTQKRLIQASYDPEKEKAVPEAWQTYLNRKDAEKRLLLFNAPLIHQGQHYRFIHKSIQDYCVARTICGPQFNGAQPSVEAVLNRFLLIDESLILDFLVERVKQYSAFKAHLYAWIEASKERKAAVTVGAANAITILVRAGVQFNEVDLRRIRIPGADLSCGVFDSAQLHGADLRGVNFRQVWLRGANLSKAQTLGVKFGEWPTLKVKSTVYSCAYSPDGKACAMGFYDGKIRVYDTLSWTKIHTLRGHEGEVRSVVYSPNKTQLASGSEDKTVRLWDVQRGESGPILRGHEAGVNSVAYSPNGEQLASGSSDGTVRLWDAERGKSGPILRGHEGWVYSVAYSPNGEQLASGGDDKAVRLWDVQRGEPGPILRGHEGGILSVAYSPNGTQLASGSDDRTVRLWGVQSGETGPILRGHEGWILSVVYSPSGAQLASGSSDKTVRLWDVQRGEPGPILRGHEGGVSSVAYSPDGTLASGGNDKTVRLWDVQRGETGPILRGHEDAVRSIAYSPSGAQLASGSDDKTIRLWEVQRGESGPILRGHEYAVRSVAYSPNGALVSGSDDSTVRLWNISSGECLRTIQSFTGPVVSVAWQRLAEGEYVLTGSADKLVRKWEIKKEREGYKVKLDWMSGHSGLMVNGTLIEGVKGLSEVNYKLLKQRGALFSENRLLNLFQRNMGIW